MHNINYNLTVNNEIGCPSDLSAKQHMAEKQGLRKPFVGQKGLRNNSSSYLILEAFPAVTVPPFSLKLGRSFFSFTGSK
jgi:hypothetical protein